MAVHRPDENPAKPAPKWVAPPKRPGRWNQPATTPDPSTSTKAQSPLQAALGSYEPVAKTPPPEEAPAPSDDFTNPPSPMDADDDEFVTVRIRRDTLSHLVKEILMNANNPNAKPANGSQTTDSDTAQPNADTATNANEQASTAADAPSPVVAAAKKLNWTKIGQRAAVAAGVALLGAGSFLLARKYNLNISTSAGA